MLSLNELATSLELAAMAKKTAYAAAALQSVLYLRQWAEETVAAHDGTTVPSNSLTPSDVEVLLSASRTGDINLLVDTATTELRNAWIRKHGLLVPMPWALQSFDSSLVEGKGIYFKAAVLVT